MADELAISGGDPAIAMEQDYFTQWPIYGEEEADAVAGLVRGHKLSSTQPGGPIAELEGLMARRRGVRFALAHPSGTAALRSALFGFGVCRATR